MMSKTKNYILLRAQNGKLAEWLKAAVSKTAVVSQLPGVRIPHFPQNVITRLEPVICSNKLLVLA